MIFLPYMAGERSPYLGSGCQGCILRTLTLAKRRDIWCVLQWRGLHFLKHNLDIAESTGASVKELMAMGGSANSLLWTQIKSDITGKPIEVPSSDTATTLGAAILAGVGVGLYKDFEEAVNLTVKVTRRHEPKHGEP